MNNKPHVLLIHLDQLRWDCLSVYGNKQVSTPHIDALAQDSAVHDNHFCSYPVCTPSRYSLLSGLDVQDHKGWDNHCTLKSDIETWPRVLKRNGYRTTAVGKMHFTPTYLDAGFENMILCEQDGPGRWDDDYHRELVDKGLIDFLDIMDQRSEYRKEADDEYWDGFGTAENNLEADMASSGWIASKAEAELKSWGSDPECLMVGFVKPHHPFDPPAPWCDQYNPSDLELLPGWIESCLDRDLLFDKGYFDHTSLNKTALRRIMAAYYGCISEIDSYIGNFIRILKEKALYEDTVIILTSDHGEYMGYHHMLLKSNHMYDPLMRIPLMIKSTGSVCVERQDELSCNTDTAAMILEECGIQSEVLKRKPENAGKYIFAHSSYGVSAMIRSSRYKLIFDNRSVTICFSICRMTPMNLRMFLYRLNIRMCFWSFCMS